MANSYPQNESELKKRIVYNFELQLYHNNLLSTGSLVKQSQQKEVPHLHLTALHPSYRSITCLHEGHGLKPRLPLIIKQEYYTNRKINIYLCYALLVLLLLSILKVFDMHYMLNLYGIQLHI